MAFPMMPQAQWDLVRKMGPDELNKAAMGEYQAQGISPVFALARIKEETALAAAFEAQAKKQQQEEQAKIQGVPVGDIPFTVAEGMLRERGITGVDSSAGREMPPEQMAALQGGIAGGQPMGMEGPPVGMEGPPPMMEGQPPGMGGQPPMMAYGGGLIPRMAYGGLISDSRAYQQGGQVQDPLDAQEFMELFGFSPTDEQLAEYNASDFRFSGGDWTTISDTPPPVDPQQPGTAPTPVVPRDSIAPPPPVDIDPHAVPMETVDPGVPSTQVSQGEAQRLAGVQERLEQAQSGLATAQTLNPDVARQWEKQRDLVKVLRKNPFFNTNLTHYGGSYNRNRGEILDVPPTTWMGQFEPLEAWERQIEWLSNDRPEEEVRGDLSRAFKAVLEDKGRYRTEAPTQDELMSNPSYRLAAEEMQTLGYTIPSGMREQLEGVAEVTGDEVDQVGGVVGSDIVGQVGVADPSIMEEAGATYIPGPPSLSESRAQNALDNIYNLYESASTYSPEEQDIHAEELRLKRQAIADLDRLEEMRQAGIIDQIGYLNAKDRVRLQVENTTNLRFDQIEDEQRAIRAQGAAQISTIDETQAAGLKQSDELIAELEKDLADRRKASTAQQELLGNIFGERETLSAKQLKEHRALATDQEKAIRAQANRFADSTLFVGVGDQLRGSPRDQRFGDVISAVGDIRSGELQDLMGVQTDLLEKTTAIEDELIAEKRDVFEEIYNVGEVTQTAQEAATSAIGASQKGVQDARVRADTERAAIQNSVLNSQLTSNAQIYEMSRKLMDSKLLALEERRVLQNAINQGDIETQRQILAAHADFNKHKNVVRAEVESMEEDAMREMLAVEIPLTTELARVAATREGTAAQERVTRENLLADPKSWQALEMGQQHRIQDLNEQDWTEGGTVPPQEAAAQKRNAIAILESEYSNLLRQQWGFLQRQGDALARQRDPTVIQTVITRLVDSGMPENIRTVEGASEWVAEQEVGLKGQMQRRRVENAAGLAEVLRRGEGRPPEWARTMPELYQHLLENDPDFDDPDSPLFGESQPMTGIRSIPKGSAGKGYGDTPLEERTRQAVPLGLQPDGLFSPAMRRRLRNIRPSTPSIGG